MIEQLKQAITMQLDVCDGIDTPTICNLIRNGNGKDKVVEMAVEKVLHGRLSIAAAILSIEIELNPNLTES